MTTQNAWRIAWARFVAGFGEPDGPDFDDPEDRADFLQLLADAVRDGMEAELERRFAEDAAKIRAELAAREGDTG